MPTFKRVVATALAVFAVASSAQAAGLTVSGYIRDVAGNVITRMDGFDVELTGAGGVVYKAPVKRDGTYAVSNVPAGTYSVRIPIPCCIYAPYQQDGLEIKGKRTAKLDFTLANGVSLGTIGNDPGRLNADMRARTKNADAPAPRLADGRPDLSGVWTQIGARPDPGSAPMQEWARTMYDELRRINIEPPAVYCLPQSAVPTLAGRNFRFVHSQDRIVQIAEFVTPAHRQIFMDGRSHPDMDTWNPAWYGHSIGRWDGDTLVVDSLGFNEITPGFGVHSEQLRIIERYRRLNYGTMEVEVTATDPEAWTGPYSFKILLGLAEGEEVQEYVCAENNEHLRTGEWKGRP
jgi:hypothetical protein